MQRETLVHDLQTSPEGNALMCMHRVCVLHGLGCMVNAEQPRKQVILAQCRLNVVLECMTLAQHCGNVSCLLEIYSAYAMQSQKAVSACFSSSRYCLLVYRAV